jgi:hypothetical protein
MNLGDATHAADLRRRAAEYRREAEEQADDEMAVILRLLAQAYEAAAGKIESERRTRGDA